MSDTDLHVARTVTRLAEQNGVSLKRLAEKAKMPYRTVQNYLTGEVKIPSDFIAQCCRIFQVDADFLLFNHLELEQKALVVSLADLLRPILPEVEFSTDGLRIKAPGSNAFDDPAARALHESAVLHQFAAALRHGYVKRREADLNDDDTVFMADTVAALSAEHGRQ